MSMSPLQIRAILWHYAIVTPFPEPSPAYDEVCDWMAENDLAVLQTNGVHVLTERGRVLVEMLCETPLPVYCDPRRMPF